jgi:hypothetical protein
VVKKVVNITVHFCPEVLKFLVGQQLVLDRSKDGTNDRAVLIGKEGTISFPGLLALILLLLREWVLHRFEGFSTLRQINSSMFLRSLVSRRGVLPLLR